MLEKLGRIVAYDFDPHRDPHAKMVKKGSKGAEEMERDDLSNRLGFYAYITCDIKLPMVCAASSCICLVA